MVEFRPLLVNFLLAGLIILAIISGGILLAQSNDAPQSIANDSTISNYATSLSNELKSSESRANNVSNSSTSSSLSLTQGVVFLESLGGTWKILKVGIITVYNLTAGLLISKILSSPVYSIIFAVIGGIITITIIFAAWKMLSTGEGG